MDGLGYHSDIVVVASLNLRGTLHFANHGQSCATGNPLGVNDSMAVGYETSLGCAKVGNGQSIRIKRQLKEFDTSEFWQYLKV